uniref:Histone-lysine N-methyltransferase NSD-like variant PHD zinc finger domain-containing protein n=1 Tax=Macrostomum lignano TaxID=282301 RepID=A0A1I8FIB7_9PLAT
MVTTVKLPSPGAESAAAAGCTTPPASLASAATPARLPGSGGLAEDPPETGGGGLVCPQHECLTCRLGPPDQAIGSCNGIRLRLLRCVRCPAAYHAGQRCLPAGSRLLGSGKGYIVCPAHSKVGDPSTLDRCLACCQSGGEESDGSSAAVAENGSAKPSCGSSRRKSSNVASST